MSHIKTLAVVRQEPRPEKLRKIPLYGKGEPSWGCQRGRHWQCTKLTCSCECHGEGQK